MPTFKKSTVSTAARVKLAELLDAKAEAIAERQEAQARVARLSALATAPDKPRAALARLNAAEAEAYATWSRNPDSPPPNVDSAARTDLQRELAEAQSRADAGARAVEGVRADMNAADARSNALDRELQFAVASVALEELQPLADDAREVMARLAAVKLRGQTIARVLGSAAPGPDVAGFTEWSASYAAAGEALRTAFDLPFTSEDAEREYAGRVYSFLTALRADAGAKLESADA